MNIYKIDHNSKNKDRKIDFSFDSALCQILLYYFMKLGEILRGGRVCISLLGTGHFFGKFTFFDIISPLQSLYLRLTAVSRLTNGRWSVTYATGGHCRVSQEVSLHFLAGGNFLEVSWLIWWLQDSSPTNLIFFLNTNLT